MAIPLKRGNIFLARLDPVVGKETGKTRPVLVIQNNIGNAHSPTTIVAVLTEFSDKKAAYPFCVPIPAQEGLAKHSIANLAQIRTIDVSRLCPPRLATLSSELMSKVDAALRVSLGL